MGILNDGEVDARRAVRRGVWRANGATQFATEQMIAARCVDQRAHAATRQFGRMHLSSSIHGSTTVGFMRRAKDHRCARTPLGVWAALLVAALVAFQHSPAAVADPLPNIVYILADDMGVGDVRSYTADSPVNTPNIDRIANAGMRFTDAHSLDSVCTPSRYGILTGQYGWRSSFPSGVLNGFSSSIIPSTRLTVAEMLKASGYSTGMFGKWHEGVNWVTTNGQAAAINGSNVDFSQPFTGGPINHGFDTFFGISGSANEGPYAYLSQNMTVGIPTGQVYGNPSNNLWNHVGPIAPGYDIHDLLPAEVSQATQYIGAKANQANPFFAYIPLTAPHEPIVPPSFANGQTGLNGNNTIYGSNSEPQYGDFIWSTDWAVGQILDKLNDPNGDGNTADSIANNTIVVFTADNGATKLFSFNSSTGSINGTPMHGDKGTVYEGGFRVPFVVQWPGHIQAGVVNNDIIELNDLMWTTAAITNYTLPTNAGEDSVNILPELLGTSGTPVRNTNVGHSFVGAFTIRQTDSAGNNYKLIFSNGDGSANASTAGTTSNPKSTINDFTKLQLYNLTTDPGEQTNLLSGGGTAEMQQKALQLQHVLQGYMFAGRSVNIPPRSQPNDNVVLVDFGENSLQTSGSGWNNATGAVGQTPAVATGLYDQGGGYTGIVMRTSWTIPNPSNPGGVASLGANLWGDNAGENYPAAISGQPVSALEDAWYVRNGNKMTISLENLDAHAQYDFLFYGASGASGPEYSLFTVNGSTSQQSHITPILNNSTQVATVNGIMPNAQDMITIDFEGRFADGSVGGGGFLNFMRIIEHLLEIPGDYNGDRYVDSADYVAWQHAYGSTGSGLAADGNHDGIVDTGDYLVWRKAFQSIAPASGLGTGMNFPASVPEPGSCLLLTMGLIGLFANARRRRRVR
jgi:arylsulfatase A